MSLDFCPSTTQLLVKMIEELFVEDDETGDALDMDLDNRIPLLTGSLAFPGVNCVLHVFEPRYRLMLRRVMQSNRRRFGLCLIKRKKMQGESGFHEYGTMLELTNVQTFPDGRSIVQAVGSHRFHVLDFQLTDGYHMAEIERVDDLDTECQQMMEQQQILRSSASRARLQRAPPVSMPTTSVTMNNQVMPSIARPAASMATMMSRPAARPAASMMTRPVARPAASMMTRPAARPAASMMTRPAARPAASMMTRPTASMMTRPANQSISRPVAQRPPAMMMANQRRSWAQQAHPQTTPENRAPWLQMHFQGLTVEQPKPKFPGQQQQAALKQQAPIVTTPVVKHREETSTEELIDELCEFIEKLVRYKQNNPNTQWLNTLGDPPPLERAARDRVKLMWWIANMMPLNEEEKIPLLAHRVLRERVLLVISWKDRFEDQWSFYLNNNNPSNIPSSSQGLTCCIS